MYPTGRYETEKCQVNISLLFSIYFPCNSSLLYSAYYLEKKMDQEKCTMKLITLILWLIHKGITGKSL